MRKIVLSKKERIRLLEAEVKRLKEIIAWQSKTMAGLKPPKLTLKK